MKEDYKIYCHISPNGKIYVGMTKQKVARRWRNGKGYVGNDYFNNAIKKYGWDNFQHEIVASGISRDEALNFEKILIQKLNTMDREYGYNRTKGGDGVVGSKCPQWKKDKQSKEMIGKGNHMYGISLEGMSGEDNPMYGKIAVNRRKVRCITTGEVFEAVRHANIKYGIHNGCISKVCNGSRKSSGKLNGEPLRWEYVI